MQTDTSSVKKYLIVKQASVEGIRSKKFKPGDRIPSCRELQKEFKVSAVTAQKAVSELIQDGVLFAIQGKGTFVKQNQIFWRTTSGRFASNMEGSMDKYSDETIEIKELKIVTNKDVAAAFDVSPDTPFTLFHRVRFRNGEPVAVSISHMPLSIVDESDHFSLSQTKSLYATLDNKGIVPTSTKETFSVEILSHKDIYAQLKCSKNTPLLVGTRLNYDEAGRLFEHTINYLLSDRYTIVCWHLPNHGR